MYLRGAINGACVWGLRWPQAEQLPGCEAEAACATCASHSPSPRRAFPEELSVLCEMQREHETLQKKHISCRKVRRAEAVGRLGVEKEPSSWEH